LVSDSPMLPIPRSAAQACDGLDWPESLYVEASVTAALAAFQLRSIANAYF